MRIAGRNSSITATKMTAGQINCNDNCVNGFMLSSISQMEQITFQFALAPEF